MGMKFASKFNGTACVGTSALRAVPQASACGQQLLAASLTSLLGCRLKLSSADSCWAWLFLVGRLTVLTLLVGTPSPVFQLSSCSLHTPHLCGGGDSRLS
eukprot:1138494-Pelagomonas_calceolata.AAC.2